MEDKKNKLITKEKLQNIIEDESIRQTVRDEISQIQTKSKEKNVSKKKKVLNFLNTNLGIWLLSSVLLSFLTFTYSKLESKFAENRTNKEKIHQLDIEIAYRLKLRNIETPIPLDKSLINALCLPPRYSRENEIEIENPFYRWKSNRFIYPEFKERSIISLLWELKSLVSENEQAELKFCISELEKLRDIVESGNHNKTTATLNRILLSRWEISNK